MTKVVVIGAGCAGIAAAAGARKAGAEVTMLERQDQLLGIGRIREVWMLAEGIHSIWRSWRWGLVR